MVRGHVRPGDAGPAPRARRRRRGGQLLGGRPPAVARAVGGQHLDGQPGVAARRDAVGPLDPDRDPHRAGARRGRVRAARAGRGRRPSQADRGAGRRAGGARVAVRGCAVSRQRARGPVRRLRGGVSVGRPARRHADDVGGVAARAGRALDPGRGEPARARAGFGAPGADAGAHGARRRPFAPARQGTWPHRDAAARVGGPDRPLGAARRRRARSGGAVVPHVARRRPAHQAGAPAGGARLGKPARARGARRSAGRAARRDPARSVGARRARALAPRRAPRRRHVRARAPLDARAPGDALCARSRRARAAAGAWAAPRAARRGGALIR